MGDSLLAALGPGVALAGVLFVLGSAAATAGGRVPHLGIGALAPAAAVAATRFAAIGPIGAVAVAIAAGAIFGALGYALDERARDERAERTPLLPDLAVLGLAAALVVFTRPPVMVELPLGPLGGIPTTGQGIAAGIVGLLGGLVLVWRTSHGPDVVLWIVAGLAGALAVLLGSGALTLLSSAATPVFTLADAVGLGIRAAAVGVAARYGVAWAAAAAAIAGLGEAAARTSGIAAGPWAPTVLLLAVGMVMLRRRAAAQPA